MLLVMQERGFVPPTPNWETSNGGLGLTTPQEYSDVRNGADQSVLDEEIRTLACSNPFRSRDKVHPYAFTFSRAVNEMNGQGRNCDSVQRRAQSLTSSLGTD